MGSLKLLSAGLCTLVVDGGRLQRSKGVSVGGAADGFSFAMGNAMVGNAPDAPALEMALTGPKLVADVDLGCALTGAPFVMNSNGRSVQAGRPFVLPAGEVLQIQGAPTGTRGYLCIRGGLHSERILGSCSSLEPLETGACLGCDAGVVPLRYPPSSFAWNAEPYLLRLLPGGQRAWFPESAMDQELTVSTLSNRMGLRLEGKPLVVDREMASEPVCPGTIQVTREGQCVILGVDGQTIGGYPKIAQVISADLDKVGQLRPGDVVRFAWVELDEAEALFHEKQQELQQWQVRLSMTMHDNS